MQYPYASNSSLLLAVLRSSPSLYPVHHQFSIYFLVSFTTDSYLTLSLETIKPGHFDPSSVVWHGWVKGWLTPLANQLTDCHFASTNSQTSTLSRRQVYLLLDSLSPLTAMSISSLLCIHT